jgi:hypothetical protein
MLDLGSGDLSATPVGLSTNTTRQLNPDPGTVVTDCPYEKLTRYRTARTGVVGRAIFGSGRGRRCLMWQQ